MTDTNLWNLHDDEDGVRHLTLDVPGQSQNTLTHAVLDGFAVRLEAVERDRPKAVFLRSAKPSGFMAGADVDMLMDTGADELRALLRDAHERIDRMAAMAIPVVAVVDGVCVGGGLEIALACEHCVATPRSSFGLPEVQLGLHPGLGGTFRLPNRIDPADALTFMLKGSNVDARTAVKMGMIDEVIPQRHLLTAARAWAAKRRDAPSIVETIKRTAESTSLGRQFIASQARKQTERHFKKKHYPAPYALIDLLEEGHEGEAARRAEADSFVELTRTDAARNLIGLFKLREQVKREAREGESHGISHVHVIGAGAMGADIAMLTALNGFTVSLEDIDLEAIAEAQESAAKWMHGKHDHSSDIRDPLDRFIPDPNGDGARGADLVIEAGPEKVEVKEKIYTALEPKLKPGAIIATNTSSLPLEVLAETLQRPERLIGLHFFNPATKLPLVEVVHGEASDPALISRALGFVEAIGKLPIPVKSAPGFLVNRVLMPYLVEAVALMDEGYSAEEIDAAAEDFGMRQGPVEVADAVGLDICLDVAEVLSRKLDSAPPPPQRLRDMVEAGRLGKKTGEGFYTYEDGKPQKEDVTLRDSEQLQARLIGPMVEEGRRCLADGIVAGDAHLDAGVIFGAGFAPFRGGISGFIHGQQDLPGKEARQSASA